MVQPSPNASAMHAGHRVWSVDTDSISIRFVGQGPSRNRQATLQAITDGYPPSLAWLQQTHSAVIHTATPGLCGEGDGLITAETDLALCVATADCLPVVLSGEHHLALVHAGWRGIVNGILPAAVKTLPEPAEGLKTWIGPAIGPCCYQVGRGVADRVAMASGPEAIVAMPGQPHLDLLRAAKIQLSEMGVPAVSSIPTCTRCSAAGLASYRRDGTRAARNWTFAWRRSNDDD